MKKGLCFYVRFSGTRRKTFLLSGSRLPVESTATRRFTRLSRLRSTQDRVIGTGEGITGKKGDFVNDSRTTGRTKANAFFTRSPFSRVFFRGL